MTDIVWDRRSLYVYAQTEKERFEEIEKKYKQFIACLDDVNTVPISVFNLKPKQIEELQMIREVSKELQKKKEDDINKAKDDAAAELEKAQESKEQNNESKDEERTDPVSDQKE